MSADLEAMKQVAELLGEASALRQQLDLARAEVALLAREVQCYRATRSFWKLTLREAIRKGDLEAVKAETARAEAVVERWLRDSHALVEAQTDLAALMNSMEIAWGIIANAFGGDWSLATPEWRTAAERWRDEHWHRALAAKPGVPR